jgi:hypothetical protein
MIAYRRLALILGVGLAALDLNESTCAASVEVTWPRTGETLCAGSTHVIAWISDRTPGDETVRISYSVDSGKTWVEITAMAPDSGAYSWTVPDQVSRTCLLKVIVGDPNRFGDSGLFLIAPSRAIEERRWVKVTGQAAFAPRDGAGALVFRDKMWLLGGWNPGDKAHFPRICSNDAWNSSNGRDWSLAKPNTFRDRNFDPTADWEGRHTAGYVVMGDKMWIVGGDVNQGHYQSDVWNSNDGTNWALVNRDQPVPWGPRALHYTLAFRDKIWVMGGQTMPAFAPSQEVFYRDIWTSADGRDWDRLTPAEPYWSARGMIGGSVVFQDRIWILGGGTYDTPTTPTRRFFNDVWSSPDGIHWTRHLDRAPWAARQYHETAAFDGRLWVLEGYSGANRNDVWYSDDGRNWYELPGTPWAPRHAASVFVFDETLWIVAGNNMESDVWKLERVPNAAR